MTSARATTALEPSTERRPPLPRRPHRPRRQRHPPPPHRPKASPTSSPAPTPSSTSSTRPPPTPSSTSTGPPVVILAAARVGGIHANNTYPADFLYDNLTIAGNVIHAAHRTGVTKLLNLGSSCIYPKHAAQPITEDSLLTGPLEPTNRAYAIAKIAAIELCDSYRRQHGDDFISAMPTNLYGPGDNYDLQTSHVLAALIRKIHEAKEAGAPTVTVWGTGTVKREFLHADDLADAAPLPPRERLPTRPHQRRHRQRHHHQRPRHPHRRRHRLPRRVRARHHQTRRHPPQTPRRLPPTRPRLGSQDRAARRHRTDLPGLPRELGRTRRRRGARTS